MIHLYGIYKGEDFHIEIPEEVFLSLSKPGPETDATIVGNWEFNNELDDGEVEWKQLSFSFLQ